MNGASKDDAISCLCVSKASNSFKDTSSGSSFIRGTLCHPSERNPPKSLRACFWQTIGLYDLCIKDSPVARLQKGVMEPGRPRPGSCPGFEIGR